LFRLRKTFYLQHWVLAGYSCKLLQ